MNDPQARTGAPAPVLISFEKLSAPGLYEPDDVSQCETVVPGVLCLQETEEAMDINATPFFDQSVNTTGCCPKFNPEGWDGQELHFRDKAFLRARTMSAMHVPLNMGQVFSRVQKHIDAHDAMDPQHVLVLSRDLSPWSGEHLFAVTTAVPEEESVALSGDFLTRVFEGPYRDAKEWYEDMKDLAREKGKDPGEVWFFYTTCPKCAKAYGKNYVVGLVEARQTKAA